jgi:hypothetical protein
MANPSDRELFPQSRGLIAQAIADIERAGGEHPRGSLWCHARSDDPARCWCGQELAQCTECREDWTR